MRFSILFTILLLCSLAVNGQQKKRRRVNSTCPFNNIEELIKDPTLWHDSCLSLRLIRNFLKDELSVHQVFECIKAKNDFVDDASVCPFEIELIADGLLEQVDVSGQCSGPHCTPERRQIISKAGRAIRKEYPDLYRKAITSGIIQLGGPRRR